MIRDFTEKCQVDSNLNRIDTGKLMNVVTEIPEDGFKHLKQEILAHRNATVIEKLITLTLNEKIKWYTASDELFKTYNNDICIRLEIGEVFALKIDAKYYCASLDETEESDRLVTLYKAVLPRAQTSVEDKFFEGLW